MTTTDRENLVSYLIQNKVVKKDEVLPIISRVHDAIGNASLYQVIVALTLILDEAMLQHDSDDPANTVH